MNRRPFVLLLSLLLLTRAALVLGLADVFFYGEELAKGAAAKAMLDGVGVEHWQKVYVYHEGGGFVVTHLKALFFVLVGENVLAHKLAALLVTSVVLLAGLRLVREAFGERAALVFGLFFVFAPAAFLRFSLLSLGTHFEALLFLALVAHCTLRVAERERPRARDWLSLGLAAGFGLYFSLQTAPAIGASALYLALFARRRFSPRSVALALAGFAAGVAPWLFFFSRAGLDALRVRGQALGGQRGTSALDAFLGLFEPLRSQGDLFDWLAIVLYPLVIAAGFALRTPRPAALERRPALLVIFVLGLYLAAYCASGLAVPSGGHWVFFWRLSTLWFFANVLFAAAVARLWERGTRARLAASLATLALFAGNLQDLASMLAGGRPTLAENARWLADTKGYDYVEYLDKFKTRLAGTESEKIALLRGFDDDPELLDPSIAHSLFDRSPLAIDGVLAILRQGFGDRWETAAKGLGTCLAPDGRFDVAGAFERLAAAPPEAHVALAEAIGRTGRGLKVTPERIALELAGVDVPESLREPFWRGTGWRLAHFHRDRPERALAVIDAADEPTRSSARAGFEAAQRARSLAGTRRGSG